MRHTVSYPAPRQLTNEARSFTVAVKPDLASIGFIPWCIQVDEAWYELAEFHSTDVEPPMAAARFVLEDLPHHGPALLANYLHPLLVSINGAVVRCRVEESTASVPTHWVVEQSGHSSAAGPATATDTLAYVQQLAAEWVRNGRGNHA